MDPAPTLYWSIWADIPQPQRAALTDAVNSRRTILRLHLQGLDRPEAVHALEEYDTAFLDLSQAIALHAWETASPTDPPEDP